MDDRWDELAEILVDYSTEVRAGDKVLIAMGEVETLPLVRAVYGRAIQAGGHPQVVFSSAYLDRELLQRGSEEQIGRLPDLEARGIEWADVYIGLRGSRNPAELGSTDPPRYATYRRALGEISAMRTRGTRWVLVRVPSEPLAQQAGIGLDEVMRFFFEATLRDWQREGQRYAGLARIFERAQVVRIEAAGTDLEFSTRGRRYAIGDCFNDTATTEIYTAPEDTSAHGCITFELPASFGAARAEGVRLEFRDGRVVAASAQRNERLLRSVLETDAGSQRIGEFGVGTNDAIPCFFSDILYDEKMAGTVHIALGRAYAQCGGTNESAVHWDLVKDLRTDGLIRLDGRIVLEAGKWLLDW